MTRRSYQNPQKQKHAVRGKKKARKTTREKSPRSTRKQKKKSASLTPLHILLIGIAALCLFALLAALLFLGSYQQRASKYDLDRLHRMLDSHSTATANWDAIAPVHGIRPLPVPLNRVSPHFTRALIAREDNRFHQHHGSDWQGVARASLRNLKEGKVVQGASTLTMQLARNSFGITEKNFDRKLTEMMLARRIEKEFSKKEILELYVNWTFFGDAFHGIERASRAFFGKQAADLNLGESALLAGIIRAPNRFSPVSNPSGARRERDIVLERMHQLALITDDQLRAAQNEQLIIRNPHNPAEFDRLYQRKPLKAVPYKERQ